MVLYSTELAPGTWDEPRMGRVSGGAELVHSPAHGSFFSLTLLSVALEAPSILHTCGFLCLESHTSPCVRGHNVHL